MSDQTSDGAKTVANLFLVLAFIGVLAGVAFFVMDLVNKGKDELGNTISNLQETTYTQYDGATPTGSTVVNLIQQTKVGDDDIYILVKTKMNTSGVYYICDANNVRLDTDTMRALVKDMKTNTSNNYINPSKKFYGEVVRNDNDVIVGIIFTQE